VIELKKLLAALLMALLLVGCSSGNINHASAKSNKIDYAAIQTKVDDIRSNLENFGTDTDKLSKDIDALNNQLKDIHSNDKDIKKFIEYQLKANRLRIEGIKENNTDKITESSKYYYFAEGAFNKIRN
jgi:septal ring factor EnvC (AmiA/AmiB activator)